MSKLNEIRIILGCGLLAFWAGVIAFAYPGVMNTYWKEKFHVGNGETGLVVTFMVLALSMAMFISGRIHSKFGIMTCIISGTIITIIAYFFLFFARSIHYIYVWGFTANFGLSFLYGPGLTTGQQAFPTKRGLVSGILNFVFGLSAAIMSPIINVMINKPGYLLTNIIILILIIVSAIISCFLLRVFRHTQKKDNKDEELSFDLTTKEALKTKEFWIIWFIWTFIGAAGISMVSLSKSYSVYIGETGVIILTAFNLANGICRLFVGWISDLIGARLTGAIAFLLAAIGYLIVPHISKILFISLCVVGVGIGFGTLFTVSGPLISTIFGIKNFGPIYGLVFTGYGIIGGVVGPAVAGFILEKTNNNYLIVFFYLAVMALISTLLILLIKEKKINKKKNSNTNINTQIEVNTEDNRN